MAETVNTTEDVELKVPTPEQTQVVPNTEPIVSEPQTIEQPNVFDTLKQRFKEGTLTEQNIEQLKSSYNQALGQTGNKEEATQMLREKLQTLQVPQKQPVEVKETIKTDITQPEVKKTPTIEQKDIKTEQENLKVKNEALKNEFSQLLAVKDEKGARKFLEQNKDNINLFKPIYKNFVTQTRVNKKVSTFNTLDGAGLYKEVVSGNLVKGSDVWNALNPETQAKYNEYAKVQQNTDILNDKEVVPNLDSSDNLSFDSMLKKVSQVFSTNLKKEYQELLNTPELKNSRTALNDSYAEITKKKREIRDVRKRIEGELKGESNAFINAKIRKETELLQDELNEMVDGYNVELNNYNTIKSEIDDTFQVMQVEDENNRKSYEIALGLYETRRKEMREDEKNTLLEQNKIIAEDRQFARQKELAEFNLSLKQKELSGGNYVDDNQGNLVYIKDGQKINVLTGLGKRVDTSQDNLYSYTTYKNDDGTFSMAATPKKDGLNPWVKEFTIDGKEPVNYISSIGTGEITSHGGRHDNYQGLDIDGNVGDPIVAPMSGKIIEAGSRPGYGTSVVVKLADGNKIRFSHLKEGFYNVGDNISKGSVIGLIGNSGNVLKLDGTKPNAEELAKGFGSHLDIVTIAPDGKVRNAWDTEEYLNSLDGGINGDDGTVFVEDSDINEFNNSTFKPQNIKTAEKQKIYQAFLDKKGEIKSDKNASIEDILRYSQGGGKLTDTSIKALEKFDSALNQIGSIQEQISKLNTGPIIGQLAQLNPYNTDAQTLKASLTALMPNLARGVYGEVGVLTDNDIRLYAQTIPSLTSTNEVNKAVLAMTLKVVAGGYKRQLQSLAAAGKDVSGFQGLYTNLTEQVNNIERDLGIQKLQTPAYSGIKTTPSGFQFNTDTAKVSTKTNTQPYASFFNTND